LIVPPEEPRSVGASRAMTEVPLSQWLVKGTYPTAHDCTDVFHPMNGPPGSTGRLVTTPPPSSTGEVPMIPIGPFSVSGRPERSPPYPAQ
jgi:hypothetical protein